MHKFQLKTVNNMKLNNTIDVIKKLHPQTVILLQISSLYHTYGNDAQIMSYLFGYQINQNANGYNECVAPKKAINNILKTLEYNKINYITIVRSQNYEIDQKQIYDGQNQYATIYKKSRKYNAQKNNNKK